MTGTFTPWEEDSRMTMGHKVIFDNLKPDTKYVYRVGDNENWSEWFQFKTSSDKAEPFSFLYLGDVQNDIKSYGSRILRQAYTHFPDADFMLFAGDLVKESNEEYWREYFYAGGWIFGMMPVFPRLVTMNTMNRIIGSRTFSKHWNQIFTMPPNGPSEKFRNRLYFIDYQGVRFVSVDSPAFGENSEDDEMILGWLDQLLQTIQTVGQLCLLITRFITVPRVGTRNDTGTSLKSFLKNTVLILFYRATTTHTAGVRICPLQEQIPQIILCISYLLPGRKCTV